MTKQLARIKRHRGIRNRIVGTAQRPRLSVYRGLRHIYVQLIDDTTSRTLLGLSDKKVVDEGSGVIRAESLAKELAKQAKTKKIHHIVFDRGGFRYHGQIKVLAETLRQEGITI